MLKSSRHPHFVSTPAPLELSELLFALSRRHEQSFSVVALAFDTRGRGSDCPEPGQLEPNVLAALRRTDLLVRWGRPGLYGVFCPYTSAEGAKDLIQRIGTIASPRAVHGGAATFPEDALVLDELIDAAFFHAEGPGGPGAAPENRAPVEALIRRPLPSRLERTPERRRAALAKRLFDLGVLLASVPLWLPVLLGVALAIKATAPRAPVLFPQTRTGRGGRRFRMYKFRTMVPDAEQRKGDYAHLNQLRWPDFKIAGDPRITRLGRFLRKSSLDELPQVLNVLRGEMSWVGPRPTSFGAETYEIWQTARLDVVPGVTGLWQVEGRARTDFDERLRLDTAYIDRRTLWLDLRILIRTAREVFHPRGGC